MGIWGISVLITYDISFEGILSKTDPYLTEHIQKT